MLVLGSHLERVSFSIDLLPVFFAVLLEMHTNNNGLICTDFSQARLIGREHALFVAHTLKCTAKSVLCT